MSHNLPVFSRNSYGEITNPSHVMGSLYARDLYAETCHLIKLAVKAKKIPWASDSISFDRKGRADGYATHHEIYDISSDARHILLCVRESEGTKYGVKTTSKTYYIISTHGQGVRVVEAPKAKAAKAAKQAVNPGDAIAVCQGKQKLHTVSAPCEEKCFKIVAATDSFVSVFDGSPWSLGVSRSQGSTPDHDGGFYVFSKIEDALAAWNDRLVFAQEWLKHERYSLLECVCSGRRYLHDNNKICVTRVKPVTEIAALLV